MKMRLRSFVVGLGGLLLINPASAEEKQYYFDWAGAYFAVETGYGQSEFLAKKSSTSIIKDSEKDTDLTKDLVDAKGNREAILFGGSFGFNIPLGSRFYVGLEVNGKHHHWLDTTSTVVVPTKDVEKKGDDKLTEKPFGDPSKVISQQSGALQLRLGAGLDNLFPYISGGINVRQETREVFDALGKEVNNPESGNTHFYNLSYGWTLGVGLDVSIYNNFMMRLAFNYNYYGTAPLKLIADAREDKDAPAEIKDPKYVIMENPSQTSKELRLGIGYKF